MDCWVTISPAGRRKPSDKPCAAIPLPPDPCHRVVKGDSPSGFAGQNGGEPVDRKRRLLESEGVTFLEDNSIDPTCCYRFDE